MWGGNHFGNRQLGWGRGVANELMLYQVIFKTPNHLAIGN